jgi:hypothetical protein
MPFLWRLDLRGGFTRGVGRPPPVTSAAVGDAAPSPSSGTPPPLRRSTSLSFGVVAVVVALGVGAAGAAPIIVSTTQTEVTIGGLSCGTQYRVRVNVAGDSAVTTLNPVTKPCRPPQPPPPPPPECLIPSLPEGRWFSSCAAHNKPIPPGTPYRSNEQSLIDHLSSTTMRVSLGGTPAVYLADANTPTVTVYDNHPTCHNKVLQVPIPPGAMSPWGLNHNNLESSVIVLQRESGKMWDLYHATAPGEPRLPSRGGVSGDCGSPNNWNAEIATLFDPALGHGGWRGLANEICCSDNSSRIYGGAGLIRPRDTKLPAGSTYDHAISMSYSGELNQFVWPAKASDGNCTDTTKCVPAGGRFQLDPSYPCNTTTALEFEYQRQLCRTFQVYGLIIDDKPCLWPCSGSAISGVDPYSVRLNLGRFVEGGGNYRYPYDSTATLRRFPTSLLSQMHVIDWEVWTGQ